MEQWRRHEVGPTVWSSLENFDLVLQKQVARKFRHIPGHLNMVDKLSRVGQIIQTEWSVLPEVLQLICTWPQVDLFAMGFSNTLPQCASPVPDSKAWAVNTLSLPWEYLNHYAFPPVANLGKAVAKLRG